MFCEQCGTKLEEDAIFCFNCGAKVASDSPSYDDDDKTVILQEENDFRQDTGFQEEGQPAVRSDAVETGNLTAEKAGEEGATGKTTVEAEGSAEVEAKMTAEAEASAEVGAEMIPEAEASAEVEAGMTAEAGAAGGGPETVETVEISPTGVVETGTAMMVPEAMEQKKFCPNCGAPNGMNDLFCQQCGMSLVIRRRRWAMQMRLVRNIKRVFHGRQQLLQLHCLLSLGLALCLCRESWAE